MNVKTLNLFKVENLKFFYPMGRLRHQALDIERLDIPSGQLICLAGPSGSGKTTLLNILGLIENYFQGNVFFGSIEFKKISEKEKNFIRQSQIGFVFQNFLLFEALTVKENVEFFILDQNLTTQQLNQIVTDCLKSVGLEEQFNKFPAELSGGQRQRVAIARALAKRPKVIIADEPTASLDQKTGQQVMQIFKNMCLQQKTSVLYSSHDPMAQSFASQILKLRDGRVESFT